MTQRAGKLLDQVRDAIRLKHHGYSSEKIHVYRAKWQQIQPEDDALGFARHAVLSESAIHRRSCATTRDRVKAQ